MVSTKTGRVYREALRIATAQLGPNHDSALITASNLAMSMASKGNSRRWKASRATYSCAIAPQA